MKRLIAVIIPLMLAGCVGTVGYYDKAADNYVAKAAEPRALPTNKTVRYAVNIEYMENDRVVTPSYGVPMKYDELARSVISDIGLFRSENIGRTIERPDYYFIFDITVRNTGDPGVFSGLLIPFFRYRETIVRLHILNFAGESMGDYVGSGEQFYARHILLLPATPFLWPSSAEKLVESNAFHAVAVKAMNDVNRFVAQPAPPPTIP